MSLEALVFQQLQSSCTVAISQSRMTTTTANTSIRREDEDHNICPMSTAPIDTVSSSSFSSSSSSPNEAACVIPASNVDVDAQAGATEDTAVVRGCRKRRKRTRNFDERSAKDEAEMERQKRMHIEAERNRRKQMNNYLALLASLMPPPYSHRGDQASVVGGAINFVKELEQLLQYLQSHNKRIKLDHQTISSNTPVVFSDFFSFPQYSTMSPTTSIPGGEPPAEAVADVEVVVVERHVTVKVLSRKQPKQLLRMLVELESAHLTILHLNITSIDGFELCSFSLKKEDECQLNKVNEIAAAVYNVIRRIQQHAELEL